MPPLSSRRMTGNGASGERSGSDSDECMFDQTNLLSHRTRMNITRYRKNSATISGSRLTVARTVNLCLSFFALGLCFVMPTATITGLKYRTSSSEDDIEFIYTARYCGYILGCVAGGFLFNCYNRQFLLFLALLATAIGVLIMPFCRILATLMTCTTITGVTMGLLDTGGNVWLLDLWGRKSAPFMQTMHFCFGLGALVAPLVAQPFIGAYTQVGATAEHSMVNESRTILSPLGPHLSSNPNDPQRRVRRDLDGIMANLSTLPYIVSNNSISSTAPSATVRVSEVTDGSSTTKAVPKKPYFADSKKIEDKWERPAITAVDSKKNETVPSTAAAVQIKGANKVLNVTESLYTTSASTSTTSTSTTSTSTTSTSTTSTAKPNVQSTRAPVTGTSEKVGSTSSLPKPKASNVGLNSIESKGNTKAEIKTVKAYKSTTSTTPIPTTTPPISKPESTTKGTASTVPTQEAVKDISIRPTEPQPVTVTFVEPAIEALMQKTSPKHSINRKVLEDEQSAASASPAPLQGWLDETKLKIAKSGKFEIAYGILAAYVLIVSVVFLVFLCMNPREGKSKQEDEISDLHQAEKMKVSLVVLMCSFFSLYMGMEVAVGETLQSLVFRDKNNTPFTVVSGVALTYIFWGSFALARGLSIFISMKASCKAILIADMGLCIVASLTLVIGAEMHPNVLISGIVMLATGMASIIPTSFIWLERCTHVSNRLSALLILSAAAGEIVIPKVVNAFIRKTPMILMYVILVVILLCVVNLIALCYVTAIRGEKYLAKPDRSLYQLASLDDDIEHWHHKPNGNGNDGVLVKRNKNNSFFYDRLNNLDS